VAERPVVLPPVIYRKERAMPIDNQCIDYARDCLRIGRLADDPELRRHLARRAREWMAAARREKKTLNLKKDAGPGTQNKSVSVPNPLRLRALRPRSAAMASASSGKRSIRLSNRL
jgi:hypothetical protein